MSVAGGLVKIARVARLLLYAVIVAVLVGGCARHTVTRDDLRSQLTLGSSTASEAIDLISYVVEGRSTTQYAQLHPLYLAEEVDDITHELDGAPAEAILAGPVAQARDDLSRLKQEITNLPDAIGKAQTIRAASQRIVGMRDDLIRNKSGL